MWFDLIGISSNCGDVQLIYGVVESIVLPPQRTKYKECVLLCKYVSQHWYCHLLYNMRAITTFTH